jgi:Right handed beta helix region
MRAASRLVAGFACLFWSLAAQALPSGWSDQNNEGGLTISYVETPSDIAGHTNVFVALQNQSAAVQSYNLFLSAKQSVAAGNIYLLQVVASHISTTPAFHVGYHLFTAADAYITENGTNYATIKKADYLWSLPVPDIEVTHLTYQYLVPATPAVGKIQPRITVYDIQPNQVVSFNVIATKSAATGASGGGGTPPPGQTTMTSTLSLTSANNGQTFDNYSISTTSGNCVTMTGVNNVTFQNSRIGPCAGQGIDITGSSTNVKIYDSYIHVNNLAGACCDTRLGVKVQGNSSFVTIQGNVIAYNESNTRVQNGAHDVLIDGNFLLNPRGPFPRGQHLQIDQASNVTFTNNYTLSSPTGYLFAADQEDAISIYKSSGNNVTFNYINGGDSPSGCALLNDDGSNNNNVNDNTVYNSGQCGVGIATGQNIQVQRNKVLNLTPISGAGDIGLYVWNQYASACSNVSVVGNQIAQVQVPGCNPATSTCAFNGYWDGGGCSGVSLSGNTMDSGTYGANTAPAYNALKNTIPTSAPKIPPKPKNCVANSPYSNQTGFPACS